MKRALAVLAALFMIGGSIALRSAIDSDDSSSNNSDGGDGPVTLACDPALRDVCTALAADDSDLAVIVEDAAATRARLEAAAAKPDTVGIDGWLTLDPLPAIVSEGRDRANLPPILGETTAPVGRSPLVLVGWSERLDALADECPALNWKCIGNNADTAWVDLGGSAGWGRLEPGIDDIQRSALALAIGGQAAASFFDSSDFASNDFSNDGFRSWWTDLLDSVPTFPSAADTALEQMLAAGPASFDVVGTTEAEAITTVAASRDNDRLTISYPSPVVTADVVLAPIVDAPGADDVIDLADSDALIDALLTNGWRVADEPLPAGADPAIELPSTSGLPRPGVLEALRNL